MAELTLQQAFDLAFQHQQAGRLREAEAIYRQILIQQPNHAGALCNLGNVLQDSGQTDEAIAAYRRAIALNPNLTEAHYNLGNALKDSGRVDEAISAFLRTISLNPNLPEAHLSLGNALKERGQSVEAAAAYRRAIAIRPDFAEAYSNLGNALHDLGQLDEAIAACRRAVAIRPDFAESLDNLANALANKGQFDEAFVTYRRAIALNPKSPQTHSDFGNALRDAGQLSEAIAAHRRAIALKPDYAEAHFNLAMALLHCDLKQGWQEYEWRLKTRDPLWRRRFSQPFWDGGELNGRTILLYTEQGIGETIQFIRYIPRVVRRGGRVIVEAHSELIRLFKQLPGVEQWITLGEPPPAFDVQCPLPSLPRLFATTLETIPPQQAELRPDPELLATWQRRLEGQATGLKVGLNWAGNPDFKGDKPRSMTLDHLAHLSQASNVTFFSIQKGAAAQQAEHPPAGLRLVNLGPELRDFADTAAVMCLMDLVITTDTSVAHLAGALGRPVWVMLQFVPDWRWLMDRPDSPWYPSMRLFRQTRHGDWPGVITRVAEALTSYPRQGP